MTVKIEIEIKEPVCLECNKSMRHEDTINNKPIFGCATCGKGFALSIMGLTDKKLSYKPEYNIIVYDGRNKTLVIKIDEE